MKYVYFMRPKGMPGPVKIGHSHLPQDRLLALSQWSPWPLEIFGSLPGSYRDEQFLHGCFADLHSHREWFAATPEMLDTISKIVAAQSLDLYRAELTIKGSIQAKRRPRQISDTARRRMSMSRRIDWAIKRLGRDGGYYTKPSDVSDIMGRWQGAYWAKTGRQPVEPSAAELQRLEEFVSDVRASAVFHPFTKPQLVGSAA